MKKKFFVVIAIIVVLVILLTPVRMNLKDGGSVRYKALVYEVTKIHQLSPEVDGVKPYIDGFEIKILGMTVYRETNEQTNLSLCEELEVTVAELMDGEMSEEKSVRTYDDEQILDLLRRTQELEKQKNLLYGIILIVMGIALQALSYAFGGSNFKDFISGLLLGLSIAEMLVGVYVVGKSLTGR